MCHKRIDLTFNWIYVCLLATYFIRGAQPTVTQKPQNLLAPLGDDVAFNCTVAGGRPVHWYLNGIKVWNGYKLAHNYPRFNVTEKNNTSAEVRESTLTIASVQSTDVGSIACAEVGSNDNTFGAELVVVGYEHSTQRVQVDGKNVDQQTVNCSEIRVVNVVKGTQCQPNSFMFDLTASQFTARKLQTGSSETSRSGITTTMFSCAVYVNVTTAPKCLKPAMACANNPLEFRSSCYLAASAIEEFSRMQTKILSDVSTTTQSSATPTAANTESVTIAVIITVAVILNIIAVVTIVTVIAHTRKTKKQLREICEDITRSRVDLTSQGGFRSNVDLAMVTSVSAGDVRFINGAPINSPSQQAFDYGGYCDLPEMDTGQSPGDAAQLVVSRNQPGRDNAPEELYAEITSSVNGRRSTLGNEANQLQLQQQQEQRNSVYADIDHVAQQSLLQFNRHSLRGPDPIL